MGFRNFDSADEPEKGLASKRKLENQTDEPKAKRSKLEIDDAGKTPESNHNAPIRAVQLFGDICLKSLEDNCDPLFCKKTHDLPTVDSVRSIWEESPLKMIDEAYGIAVQNFKLFEVFIPLLAEMVIKKSTEYESRLARMIMDCEGNSKSHQLYQFIVNALVQHAKMPLYKALKLLIKHHTDSCYAQEAILAMVVETGPDLIRLLSYLKSVNSKRPLSISNIDRIVTTCVTYQDPLLPIFCLDSLMKLSREQVQELNQEILINFVALHSCLSEINDSREEKFVELVEKISAA